MTNLFAFTDPCEPMCDMCTPLEMTPIYTQMRIEEFNHTFASVTTTFQQAADAINQFGRIAQEAFPSPDELNDVASRALKAGRTRPADQYTLTRKPLLKNGKRR